MTTKFGFKKMTVAEFKDEIHKIHVGRTILNIQHHHTYIPSYQHFRSNNHFELQRGMKNDHTVNNDWTDIGQHFTIFPDGTIISGRSLENNPAGIFGNNRDAICIENLGFFDVDKDNMTTKQKEAIVEVTSILCHKFNLPINTTSIVYHHWFHFNGNRNNGAGGNKSCPGTNFFGGNKVEDCERNFLPLVLNKLNVYNPSIDDSNILKYAMVTAYSLNVRMSHSGSSQRAPDRAPIRMGSILRVYEYRNGWLKISKSQSHWVFSRFTKDVERYIVNTTTLNVRSGPGTKFERIGQLYKNEQVFIVEEQGIWAKIALDNRWVSKNYITEY